MKSSTTTFGLSKVLGVALACAALALGARYAGADPKHSESKEFFAHGGTTFVMQPVPGTGTGVSPGEQYAHTVDGVVWISLLGACTFHAEAVATVPTPPSLTWPITGGVFTITTADGDILYATAEGAGVEQGEFSTAAGAVFLSLYYKVTFTGGTGKLANATGSAVIEDGFFVLAPAPGSIDFPGDTDIFPPNADVIAPPSGDFTGKACWAMHGHLHY